MRAHGEATGPTGLAYKIKTPEWTKDDFNPIRNMQVTYFSMPMGLAGLAVAFKIASPWARGWAETTLGSAAAGLPGPLITAPHQVRARIRRSTPRSFVLCALPHLSPKWWWTFAIISAIVYGAMLVLYALRVALHPRKVAKEWADPARSNAFALVAALPFLFAFLVYDIHWPHVQEGRQLRFARVLWWIGAVSTSASVAYNLPIRTLCCNGTRGFSHPTSDAHRVQAQRVGVPQPHRRTRQPSVECASLPRPLPSLLQFSPSPQCLCRPPTCSPRSSRRCCRCGGACFTRK